jgi:tetratricopeptide (TPR) repeat protein
VYNDLGLAYRELGQMEVATRYSQKSLALHEIINDQRSLAMAENNLALALMSMHNYASAESHLERAMEIYEELGVERGKSHVLLSMSELHLQKGALGPAQDFGRQALELASRLGERATEAEAHQWLGRAAAAGGDESSADREFEKAIALLQQLGLTERLIKAHSAYAELLEERGDLTAAHHHLKQVVASSRPDLLKRNSPPSRNRRLA